MLQWDSVAKSLTENMLQKLEVAEYPLLQADQGFLNLYFSGTCMCLPYIYNVNLVIKDHSPILWQRLTDKMRVVYYMTMKPFIYEAQSSNAMLTPEEIEEAMDKSKRQVDRFYQEEVGWWRTAYQKMIHYWTKSKCTCIHTDVHERHGCTWPESSVTHINVLDSSLEMCMVTGPFGEFIGPSMKAFHLPRHAPGVPICSLVLSPHPSDLRITQFSLNPDSKEITVHWVSPDGDSPRTTIVLADEHVFYTSDVSAFEEVVAGSSVEVVGINLFRNPVSSILIWKPGF
ncbi:hypothetical protein DFH08DRAFT_823743 [Mycena albidolilacea]|uniref:Uncharacterized protein n=1 Tax=Mycena albidolilacea TaxID=1033008 RepID=A0AAD7EB00_9AGAR|nr:hypothetical protein DFH08DRAFT_823743 [Mycena albidolilacea]